MVSFSADVLMSDPAKIALGDQPGALEAAAADPSPDAPACHAARSAFRTAHAFRVLFTVLVFILALAATILLVYTLYGISRGWDATHIATLAGTVVTGAAAGFLLKQMRDAITVQNRALRDVYKYCGAGLAEQLGPEPGAK